MKTLYKFYWDCGRQGYLEGLFVAESEAVEKAIGKDVYFGEKLGKHSEIYGPLEEKDLTILTTDLEFIEKFEALGCGSGYNPLDYLRENL